MSQPPFTSADAYFDLQIDYAQRQISLSGEFDIATAPNLATAVAAIQRVADDTITIALDDVCFIDAAGLGALVGARAAQAERGAAVIVTGASALVRKIIQLGDLHGLLGVDEPI